MTGEPVGNTPRAQNFPGNSIRAREAAEQKPQTPPKSAEQERPPVEKIVTGKVSLRKTPWWRRAVGSVIADDATSVGSFLVDDVVVPAVRNLIRDMVVGGVDRTLYGTARNSRMGVGASVAQSLGRTVVSGSALRASVQADPRRQLAPEAMARHDFTDVILGDRQEALMVIDALIGMIDEYQAATVSDLYDLVGTTGSFADRKWGWYNLDAAQVIPSRQGFKLDLPRPQPLR